MGDNNNLVNGNNNSISTATTTTTAVNGNAAGNTEASSSTTTLASLPKGQRDRALTLANRDLAAAGITSPTPQPTEAALMGGTVTNAQGQTTDMAGVLQLRSQGMGWGQVAHAVDVHPAQSEQGASRSMRGAGSEQHIAGISASQSNALSRDSTPVLGASAVSVSGDANRTDLRGSTSGGMSNGRHRDHGSSVAAGAVSQSSLRGRDSGSSAIGAAASQASLQDRGNSVSAAGTFRGKEAGNDARTASAAVAGASISGPGKDRGPTLRGSGAADASTGAAPGSRDSGGQGKGKKH
ncbi:MAG: hypothetical protein ACT4P8_10950 [Betaproteobacteria bacterium]